MTTTLTFLGGAGTVTGSKFLVTVGERRILVDAGMFQGEKDLRRINWADFPVSPDTITDVLLTHAHLDHVGHLPVLVKAGFAGPVWCTAYTKDLARIVLRDAGFLQERDAEDARLGGWSKHAKPLPLYDSGDVERTLPLLTPVDYDRDLDLGGGVTARWTRAGHILGAASIRIGTPDGSVLVSGDLGRVDHPVLRSRDTPEGAEIVLVESTYGDREHPSSDNEVLADAVRRTVGRGGVVLIPAFAVDRTELVLLTLGRLMTEERIPDVPVYVDSPMAVRTLEVYQRHLADAEHLPPGLDVRHFGIPDLRIVRDAAQSEALNRPGHSCIIISASGMATGGRVLHHLRHQLPSRRNCVVLTGYQAAGTRGRSLVEGTRQVKIHGRYVPVKADIVVEEGFSVHADASELVEWVGRLPSPPETVYCVHGEPGPSQALADRIEDELEWIAVVPRYRERVRLD